MKLKSAILFIVLSTCLSLGLFAQNREIIALNQFRGPLDESNKEVHTYNKIVSYTPDSIRIEKVYNLNNNLLSTTRESFNPELGYVEAVRQNFDSLSNHTSTRFTNVENRMWLEIFFENGEEISRLQYSGNKMFRFDIVGLDTPIITTTNPLVPGPKNGQSHFFNYFSKKLVGIKNKESGTLIIGIHVDEMGNSTKIEWLNQGIVSLEMGQNVVAIFESYDFQFDPALDTKGNPTAAVLRLPVRIKSN